MKLIDSRSLKSALSAFIFGLTFLSLDVSSASAKECIGFYKPPAGLFSSIKQRWLRFQKQEKLVRAIFKTNDPVTVKWADQDLIAGDKYGQVSKAVRVSRMDSNFSTYYNRTNRGFKTLQYFYPTSKLLPSDMKNKKVLDLAMGGGRYVQELNSWGIEAFGLDIALSQTQLNDVYVGSPTQGADGLVLSRELGHGKFVQADARQTGLASNQFDIIFSTYGMFEYDIGIKNRDPFLLEVLQELKRILKVGGVIRISPVFKNDTDLYLKKLVDQVDGLQIIEVARVIQSSRPNVVYVEITKIKE